MGSKHSSPVMEKNRPKKTIGVSLPSDLLIVIFEDLNNMSPRNISRLRLVSKQVDAVIVPMMYRNLVLTNGVVACFGNDVDDEAQLQVARDVRHHTRGVGIENNGLSWPLVGNLLGSLDDLRCLSWSMIEPSGNGSFIYEDTSPSRPAVEDFVGGLLEASSNLQRLHLVAGEALAHVNARTSAIEELVLEKYDWRPDPRTVPLLWDLSQLTHLELKNMNIIIFVEEIRPDQFPKLRSFKTDSRTYYPDCDGGSLCSWISELSSLESLEFRYDPSEPKYLDVIKKHALTLRTLDIPEDTSGDVDHDGAWHRGRACELLAITYPSLRLRHLTLGINPDLLTYSMNQDRSSFAHGEVLGTTNILAQFCDLRYLTVVAHQPYITDIQANRERNGLTHGAARRFIEELVTEKMGVRFEEIVIRMMAPRPTRLGHDEDGAFVHLTYTYEGERHEDNTLLIRDDMHIQYAEV